MSILEVKDRVERERTRNEHDDIIERSQQLKDRFAHVLLAPSAGRLRRDEWMFLESARGALVLDYGCGKGEYALKLLRSGAKVHGIDIAQNYVDTCLKRVEEAGVDPSRYKFEIMDAHELKFPDNTFDFVVGNGILHHLNFVLALSEIQRVLKPGGRAIFQEPLGGNPLLKLFRRLTPEARTEDERPLLESDLAAIEKGWKVESRYYGMVTTPIAALTSVLLRPWPENLFVTLADGIDRQLVGGRMLRSWHQYVLLNLVKGRH